MQHRYLFVYTTRTKLYITHANQSTSPHSLNPLDIVQLRLSSNIFFLFACRIQSNITLTKTCKLEPLTNIGTIGNSPPRTPVLTYCKNPSTDRVLTRSVPTILFVGYWSYVGLGKKQRLWTAARARGSFPARTNRIRRRREKLVESAIRECCGSVLVARRRGCEFRLG